MLTKSVLYISDQQTLELEILLKTQEKKVQDSLASPGKTYVLRENQVYKIFLKMNMNTQEETRKDNKKDREDIGGELE